MRGVKVIRTRVCRQCGVTYKGSRSYCTPRCQSKWKYHHARENGEHAARLANLVEQISAVNLAMETAMPWERLGMRDKVRKLQDEYEEAARADGYGH